MTRYTGPIVDAHHHLWSMSEGKYPWLTSAEHAIKALGDISYLQRDYLPADFMADAAGHSVVASVCVEAGWDRSRSPVEEAAWHHALARPDQVSGQISGQIAGRFVGWAALRAPDIEAVLEELAGFPALIGLRETIRWHPDPAKRWAEAGLLQDPDWRRGHLAMRRHGLLLEVLMNPYQAEDVARLAADHPDQQIVVDHCGTPVDRDPEGLQRWRDGLARMGEHENIAIKLSNFPAYAAGPSEAERAKIVFACLDAFGTGRAMFASDFPVGRRNLSYGETCSAMKDILASLSGDEQRAVFHDNAARIYRFAS